jgi:hypothetical protein
MLKSLLYRKIHIAANRSGVAVAAGVASEA